MPEEPFALTLQAPQPVGDDYDAIHAAVMETARGRWFLKEYARHNRNADTTLLLAAIERIETALRNQTAIPAPSHPAPRAPQPSASAVPPSVHTLHELRDAITLTRDSLPAIDPEGRIAFKADFSLIPSGVATVADRMRASAEQVQETAWFLRERAERETGALKDALGTRCNELETQARELTAACAQLDQLSESASMIAALLAEIETQLGGMISAAPPHAETPPEPVAARKPFAMPAKEEPPAPAPVAKMPVPGQPSAPPPRRDEPPPPPVQAFVDIPPITTTVTGRPVEPAPAPEPEPAAATMPPSPTAPEIIATAAPAAEAAPEIVAAAPAPQPAPVVEPSPPAAVKPQASAAPRPDWMDALAPAVRARNAPDPATPAAISFDFDDARPAAEPSAAISFDFNDSPPAIAMPNPARREAPASDLVPPEAAAPAPRVHSEVACLEIAEAPGAKADIVPTPLVPRVEVSVEEPPQTVAPAPIQAPVAEPAQPPAPVTAAEPVQPLANIAPEPKPTHAANGSSEHAKPAVQPVQIAKPADVLAPIMALSDEEKIALFS